MKHYILLILACCILLTSALLNTPYTLTSEECDEMLSKYNYQPPSLHDYNVWRSKFMKYSSDHSIFIANARQFTCQALSSLLASSNHHDITSLALDIQSVVSTHTITLNTTTYGFLTSPFAATPDVYYKMTLNPQPISSHFESIMMVKPDNYITYDQLGPHTQGDLPTSFDWREHGRVTRIKDQGPFGTCWAFSASGAVEGALAGIGLPTVDISVGTSVECDNSADYTTKKASCMYFGGWPAMTMQFHREKQKGYRTWDDFPYVWENDEMKHGRPCMPKGYSKELCDNHDDLYCKPETSKGQGPQDYCNPENGAFYAQVKDINLIHANETLIQYALMEYGPLSIAVNADNLNWYSSGIYNDPNCSKFLNHAVLLVGWGVTTDDGNNTPYWIIKNTWSESWGESGYYRLFRGTNQCGVADQAVAVTLTKA